jgi:hypothetical protein
MPTPREKLPPAAVDGALVRLMTDDRTVWVEQWNGTMWVPGGAMVDEVMKGPTASAETLRMFSCALGS